MRTLTNIIRMDQAIWQMKRNANKCAVLRCTHSHPLYNAIKECHIYLGVEIDNSLKWASHVQTVSNKSTKVLNFIKHNCPVDTKRTAYLTLVRPIMEYAAPVWDPYYNVDTYMLEKVQRRAA